MFSLTTENTDSSEEISSKYENLVINYKGTKIYLEVGVDGSGHDDFL